MTFWNKVHSKQSKSLDTSETSLAILDEWVSIYQAAVAEGQKQAIEAVVSPIA